MKILFLGAPGSGKSTQGKILAEEKELRWLSSGEMFRNSKDPEILEILKTSQLVSDEVVNKMMLKAILEIGDNFILDGYPRNLAQAEFLIKNNIKIDLVIEVAVSDEEIFQRLAVRGRDQDEPEIIRERIRMYEQTRDEIVEYLTKNGVRFERVNGEGKIDEIKARIFEVVK